VICLVRAPDRAAGFRRLHDALQRAAAAYPEGRSWKLHAANLSVVLGDVTRPQCGVAEAVREPLRGLSLELWHFAASLQFEDSARAAIWEANVDGTSHALTLAQALSASRFVHMSTAYTAGTASGSIAERLHPQQGPFHNEYERSKCCAEHAVLERCQRLGMDARILRPSIVVGPRSGESGGATSGLYGFMRELFRLRRTLSAAKTPLVMVGAPSTPLNLIPVDTLVDELVALRCAQFPGGPIYHLTSTGCPRVSQAVACASRAVGLAPLRVAPQARAGGSPIEHALERRTRFYASYLGTPKHFERQLGPGPRVSAAQLARYCAAYGQELRRQHPLALFERRRVHTTDGTRLMSYAVGPRTRSALILVNAHGLSTQVLVPLVERLAGRCRVITWRPRSVAPDASIARHARDLHEVMAEHGLRRAHVAGWCSGADVALAFASRHPGSVRSLCLLNGALLRAEAPLTRFQQRLRAVVEGAARSLEHARLYHEILYGERRARTLAASGCARERLEGLLSDIDPRMLHLASAPFATPEALHAYARSMHQFFCDAGASWPGPGFEVPTLVVTSDADRITHPAASHAFADRFGAQRLSLPEAGHFAHATHPEVAQSLLQLMAAADARPVKRSHLVTMIGNHAPHRAGLSRVEA
jgi:nucleoside-diphosphate-sugar epimerase/pimeloyl-ACP methyl ester carboxylesterase